MYDLVFGRPRGTLYRHLSLILGIGVYISTISRACIFQQHHEFTHPHYESVVARGIKTRSGIERGAM
ncbi:hypothetical protein EYC80_008784 [Monilinia laxa]|uniref:Uncharacterized protein n=1 Tax=Monilinia laxa TaxID=61186 RepID=A0A5N6K1Q3_MONLA|nr:hypothetical protein EYC80_008784 [Monilinia laxa]